MNNKRVIYFPSFSAGAIAQAMSKNIRMPKGMGFRYYAEDFPEKYRMNTYLTTAGHYYKKKDYSKAFDFPEDMIIFGDSGGYQVASGNLKYTPALIETIFKWLEENSTVAANLDIPPKGANVRSFNECLELSVDNFKYFDKHRSGKTDFLNVLQVSSETKTQTWYNAVKDFEFSGWSMGFDLSGNRLYQLILAMAVMVEHGEHLKNNNKWFHFLGVTGTEELIYLEQFQKSLNDVGCNIQVSTDSSSPNIQAKFGGYWIPKGLGYSNIHVPRGKDGKINYKGKKGWLPITNDFDRILADQYDYNMSVFQEFKSEAYALIVLHNYVTFIDNMNLIREAIHADEYFQQSMLSRQRRDMLKIIDQIVKSSNPIHIFRKNAALIGQLNEVKMNKENIAQEFFTF